MLCSPLLIFSTAGFHPWNLTDPGSDLCHTFDVRFVIEVGFPKKFKFLPVFSCLPHTDLRDATVLRSLVLIQLSSSRVSDLKNES